jgi:hypothetical protein
MPGHIVLNPNITDVQDTLNGCVPGGSLLAVLSNRPRAAGDCDAASWIYGGSLDNLCQRFKRYRKTYPRDQQWVVAVDMGAAAPVSKAYNQLFKTTRITVVTVSSDPAALKDYRFTTQLDSDYTVVAFAPPREAASSSWWPFS